MAKNKQNNGLKIGIGLVIIFFLFVGYGQYNKYIFEQEAVKSNAQLVEVTCKPLDIYCKVLTGSLFGNTLSFVGFNETRPYKTYFFRYEALDKELGTFNQDFLNNYFNPSCRIGMVWTDTQQSGEPSAVFTKSFAGTHSAFYNLPVTSGSITPSDTVIPSNYGSGDQIFSDKSVVAECKYSSAVGAFCGAYFEFKNEGNKYLYYTLSDTCTGSEVGSPDSSFIEGEFITQVSVESQDICGDNICGASEDEFTCETDCGVDVVVSETGYCGDNICQATEASLSSTDPNYCSYDCPIDRPKDECTQGIDDYCAASFGAGIPKGTYAFNCVVAKDGHLKKETLFCDDSTNVNEFCNDNGDEAVCITAEPNIVISGISSVRDSYFVGDKLYASIFIKNTGDASAKNVLVEVGAESPTFSIANIRTANCGEDLVSDQAFIVDLIEPNQEVQIDAQITLDKTYSMIYVISQDKCTDGTETVYARFRKEINVEKIECGDGVCSIGGGETFNTCASDCENPCDDISAGNTCEGNIYKSNAQCESVDGKPVISYSSQDLCEDYIDGYDKYNVIGCSATDGCLYDIERNSTEAGWSPCLAFNPDDGNICTVDACQVENGNATAIHENKVDGTVCGNQKFCLDGECISIEGDSGNVPPQTELGEQQQYGLTKEKILISLEPVVNLVLIGLGLFIISRIIFLALSIYTKRK